MRIVKKHTDPYIEDEIYGKNVYGIFNQDLKDSLVFDIGAHYGTFSILAIENDAIMVHCVEPDEENFKKLEENMSEIDRKKYDLHNLAIHSLPAVFLDGTGGHARVVGPGDIQTMSLECLIDHIHHNSHRSIEPKKTIIKIDCEGSEYSVLLNSSRELIRTFDSIFIEIHNTGSLDCNFLIKYIEFMGFKMQFRNEMMFFHQDKLGNTIGSEPLGICICRFDKIGG